MPLDPLSRVDGTTRLAKPSVPGAVKQQPLALPPCEPNGPDPAAVATAIARWVTSPELIELVGYFGGEVPDSPIGCVLKRLAEFSRVWDFRAGVRERFDIPYVDYGQELDGRLRTLIRALRLGGAQRPAHDTYDHVVVLGSGIRLTLGRAEFAARLLAGGLRTRTLTGLGSLRRRDDREQREGSQLGLEPFETEADMMLVALRRFINLPEPTTVRTAGDWWHRAWMGSDSAVAEIDVLAAASSRPPLRANTADTLVGWAKAVRAPAPSERVLLVTNDPYVLHQHCDAVRLLGVRYGCGVETVGFDEATMRAWGRPPATTELLQEVRSSLLAMRNLYDAVAVPR